MNTDFKKLGLSPILLDILKQKGYENPTMIQEKAIPSLLAEKDLLGIAKTGSGKTAAFCLPIIHRFLTTKKERTKNHIRSLILTPTRELASQIENNIKAYSQDQDISSKVVFGGVGKIPQIEALEKGLDVLVATPGRLLDLIDCGHILFDSLEIFVLDEADMMLDMGFLTDVKKVISCLPVKKQSVLFSATMPDAIEELSNEILENPIKVEVEVDNKSTVADTITHKIFALEKSNKPYLINSLLEDSQYSSILLFCKTKFGADRIIEGLERIPVSCAVIHSNKSQGEREKALKSFKDGNVRVLVATDIAARGIDIKNVSHVINFNLPEDPKSYIHRVGRTGRAGNHGTAISFCVESEVSKLLAIQKLIGEKIPIDHSQPFHKDFSFELPSINKSKNDDKKKKKRRRR